MKLEITADDIRDGQRGQADSCPVALALKRAIPDSEDVEVDVWLRCFFDRIDRRIAAPEVVLAFIERFDAGEPVEPFMLEIPPPIEWNYYDEGTGDFEPADGGTMPYDRLEAP